MARLLAAGFAAALLAASIGFLAIPSAPPPSSPSPSALARTIPLPSAAAWSGPDALVSEPGAGQTAFAETTVAMDPRDPMRVVAAGMDFARDAAAVPTTKDPSVHLWSSADGGATWTDRGRAPFVGRHGEPLTCADPYTADPSLAFDAEGVVHLAYLSYGCSDPKVVALVASADGGATWGPASIALVGGAQHLPGYCDSMDREWLVSDPADGGLVLTWTAFLSDCKGTQVGYPVMSARSFDGGATWGDLTLVGRDATDRTVGANARVGPDGAIYVAYPVDVPMQPRLDDARCPDVQVADYVHPQAQRMMLAVSTDGGRSYARHEIGPVCPLDHLDAEHPFANGGAWFSHPGIAVDGLTGAVYVAWADRAATGTDALVVRSDDQGATWSRVHVSGGGAVAALLPQLVARGGHVAMLSLRETSAGLYDAAIESSEDGGATWSAPLALNGATMCTCYTQLRTPERAAGQFGHYVGLDAQGGRIVATWMDNRDPVGPQTIHARSGTMPS